MNGPRTESLAESQDEKEFSALMRKAQAGDREAYHALLLRVKSMVESYVKNSLFRLGHRTPGTFHEDLVQEILLGFHSKRQTYDPSQFFLPWLYAIARYKVVDFIRESKKRSAHVDLTDDLPNPSGMHPEDAFARMDTGALLSALPQKQKEVLEMVKVEGLSVAEASARTGFSESDIKVTVHRALKALQKKLRGSSS